MMGKMTLTLLAVSVFVSAIAVIYSIHQSRKLFVQLQSLQAQRDAMDVEWGRLQLEQSTWATDARIEELARRKLDMIIPAQGAVVMVRP
ncbi:MAG TPA: cell division protein FtsL [Gammaproteobacteria bacterium]